MTSRAAGEMRLTTARCVQGTENDTQHTAAKSSETGGVSSRKQPANDIKAHGAKQVWKTGGKNVVFFENQTSPLKT